MIIKNKKLRVIVVGEIKLIPGMNEVSEELIKKNQKGIDFHITNRSIELPKLEIDDDLETGIASYKANDAISLIEETHDEDKLKEYLEQEKSGKARKSVIAAIEAKIQEAKDALTGSDDEGDLE